MANPMLTTWRPCTERAKDSCTFCLGAPAIIAARGWLPSSETVASTVEWTCEPCLTDALDALGAAFLSEAVSLRDWLDAQPTRESWLMERVLGDLAPIFAEQGITLPPVRVACGWTGAGHEGCTLGVCYDARGSAANIAELFISPTLDQGLDVLCVLMHELSHAVAGAADGHGGLFGTVCTTVDVTQAGHDGKGQWPLQAYPSPALQERLRTIIATCDKYPHARLEPPPPPTPDVIMVGGGGPETPETVGKQNTRMLKATCPACGYLVRLTMKWASVGLPYCGAHAEGETHRLVLVSGRES